MAKIFKECSFEFNNLTISGFAVTQDSRKFDAELLVLMSDSERYRMAVANVICTDSDGDFCWGCPEGWEVDWMPDQMGEGKQ